jgi:hypothetical protein
VTRTDDDDPDDELEYGWFELNSTTLNPAFAMSMRVREKTLQRRNWLLVVCYLQFAVLVCIFKILRRIFEMNLSEHARKGATTNKSGGCTEFTPAKIAGVNQKCKRFINARQVSD